MIQGPQVPSRPPYDSGRFSSFAGAAEPSMAMSYPSMSYDSSTGAFSATPAAFPGAVPARGARARPVSVPSIPYYPQPAAAPFPPANASGDFDDVIEGELVGDDYDHDATFLSQHPAQSFARQPFAQSSHDLPWRMEAGGDLAAGSGIESGGSVIEYDDDELNAPVLDGEPVYDFGDDYECDDGNYVGGAGDGEDDGEGGGGGGDCYYYNDDGEGEVEEEEEGEDDYDEEDDEDCVTCDVTEAAPDAAHNAYYPLQNARGNDGPDQLTDLYAPPINGGDPAAALPAFPAPASLAVRSASTSKPPPRQFQGMAQHGRSQSASFNGQQLVMKQPGTKHHRKMSGSSAISAASSSSSAAAGSVVYHPQAGAAVRRLSCGRGGSSGGVVGGGGGGGGGGGCVALADDRRRMRKAVSFPEERGARYHHGRRVLSKNASMPAAVDSRRPSTATGCGGSGGGGSGTTPRRPSPRPPSARQQPRQMARTNQGAAHPSPRTRLSPRTQARSPPLPAKSPRFPTKSPRALASASFIDGAVAAAAHQRRLAHARSLPPQSPSNAAAAAAAVAKVAPGAFAKSPSLRVGGRAFSGDKTPQRQTRPGGFQLSASSMSPALRPVIHALPVRSMSGISTRNLGSSRSVKSNSPQQPPQVEQRPQMRKPALPPLNIADIQNEPQEEEMSPSVYALQSQPLRTTQHRRQSSLGQEPKQPLKGILKSSKIQPEQSADEQGSGGSEKLPAAAQGMEGVGGNGEKARGNGDRVADRAGGSGELSVRFEDGHSGRKGSPNVGDESRLRFAVEKGQERRFKAGKPATGMEASKKDSGVTRRVTSEKNEEQGSPVMAKQCILPWFSSNKTKPLPMTPKS